MSRQRLLALALVAAALVGAVAAGRALVSGDGAGGGPGAVSAAGTTADWSYAIPSGTGARLDGGEAVEILPARIDARVGETIRIVNRDDRGYLLGPFYVGPRETLTQRFVSPGTFRGECAVHPSGQLVLVVRP